MRNLNRLPLDDDIIDRILQFSPSFPTLQSAILTSKAFYNVFKAHPRSLIRAVAYNIVGPALPQALRAVRYRVPEGNDKKDDSGSETESDSDDEHRDKAPPRSPKNASPSVEDDDEEDEETDEKILITPEEIRQLTENAKVVAELQDLLSLRHKNRKFKTSQLTPTESYSFQRAVYRIWLFSRVFHYRKYEEWNDMDRDDIPMEERIKVQQARRKFLRQFFTDELLQISAVVHFLNELTGWAWKVHDNGNDIRQSSSYLARPTFLIFFRRWTNTAEQLLAGGPAHLLKCIKDGFANLDDIWFEHQVMLEDYMSHPISGILEERQTKVPETDSAVYKLILDSVDGGNDPCVFISVIISTENEAHPSQVNNAISL
ncbi:hypothetical protein D9758_013421 [Tetrapyrgos nigripes]|uniref:F-box domain-containing protein n=1 Tax=Tetrapyrgos nigripes TaxID=182062 RepID=A0A8H5FNT6_9AGAR|nr:hypothetical protein D9758_013421 [Tetrapyrgos nigripes]